VEEEAHTAGLRLGWIGHAGLAAWRPGKAPTRSTLSEALELELDWLELDVCATSDGSLVLHHDARLPSGPPLADAALGDVRALEPSILTLDEGLEHVAGRVPVLLDIKSSAAVVPLAAWLGVAPRRGELAVCTGSRNALHTVRERAPRVPRWLTLPHPGRRAWAPTHTSVRLLRLRWRRHVTDWLYDFAAEVGASGLCVHHRLVTTALCERARQLSVPVTAWTVNQAAAARRVARCGVDLITTDDVTRMRQATARPSGFRLVSVQLDPAGAQHGVNEPRLGQRSHEGASPVDDGPGNPLDPKTLGQVRELGRLDGQRRHLGRNYRHPVGQAHGLGTVASSGGGEDHDLDRLGEPAQGLDRGLGETVVPRGDPLEGIHDRRELIARRQALPPDARLLAGEAEDQGRDVGDVGWLGGDVDDIELDQVGRRSGQLLRQLAGVIAGRAAQPAGQDQAPGAGAGVEGQQHRPRKRLREPVPQLPLHRVVEDRH
jgi:glycerophosphoryl diester phosphodiesterase